MSLNTVSVELQGGGYGDRLLAAVFSFEEKGRPIYFIYNFKRGAYYPFVPAPGDKPRDSEPSCASRPRLARSSRSRRTSLAGSRCGRSRCRGFRLGKRFRAGSRLPKGTREVRGLHERRPITDSAGSRLAGVQLVKQVAVVA